MFYYFLNLSQNRLYKLVIDGLDPDGFVEFDGQFEESRFIGTSHIFLLFDEALVKELLAEEGQFLFQLFVPEFGLWQLPHILFLRGQCTFLEGLVEMRNADAKRFILIFKLQRCVAGEGAALLVESKCG